MLKMQHMLEDYLAFARGDGGEEARPVRLRNLLEQITEEAQAQGMPVTGSFSAVTLWSVRPFTQASQLDPQSCRRSPRTNRRC